MQFPSKRRSYLGCMKPFSVKVSQNPEGLTETILSDPIGDTILSFFIEP